MGDNVRQKMVARAPSFQLRPPRFCSQGISTPAPPIFKQALVHIKARLGKDYTAYAHPRFRIAQPFQSRWDTVLENGELDFSTFSGPH